MIELLWTAVVIVDRNRSGMYRNGSVHIVRDIWKILAEAFKMNVMIAWTAGMDSETEAICEFGKSIGVMAGYDFD